MTINLQCGWLAAVAESENVLREVETPLKMCSDQTARSEQRAQCSLDQAGEGRRMSPWLPAWGRWGRVGGVRTGRGQLRIRLVKPEILTVGMRYLPKINESFWDYCG